MALPERRILQNQAWPAHASLSPKCSSLCFYASSPAQKSKAMGHLLDEWSSWQAERWDPNNLIADLKFVDWQNDDFRL
jgi:hypothetical protein